MDSEGIEKDRLNTSRKGGKEWMLEVGQNISEVKDLRTRVTRESVDSEQSTREVYKGRNGNRQEEEVSGRRYGAVRGER